MIVVITTIQKITDAILRFSEATSGAGGEIYVIGDNKGPKSFDLPGCKFVSFADQLSLPHRLVRLLPVGHYARKNIGYLLAMEDSATCIYETDDDNAPMDNWARRQILVSAHEIGNTGWTNVYSLFTDRKIWPRGLPLDAIDCQKSAYDVVSNATEISAPVQQGLVNGSPDVDAVWRLVFGDDVMFCSRPSVFLRPGAWCPFNSQSTWWFPPAYPLLYLPSRVSFRMTDIWRSFVAQRCLWELGTGLVFHGPEVVQDRNPHDLMHDFEAEIPGYLKNREIAEKLEDLRLKAGSEAVAENLWSCYEMLVEQGYLPSGELDLVRAWLDDLNCLS